MMQCAKLGVRCTRSGLQPNGYYGRAAMQHLQLQLLQPQLLQQLNRSQRLLIHTGSTDMSRAGNVAVVLPGMAQFNGEELLQTASTLIHLSRGGAHMQLFAANMPQMAGKIGTVPSGDSRNVLTEWAWISAGNVSDIARLNASNFDAVVFPGGFGGSKYASSFSEGRINSDVERVLKDFYGSKKPMGLCYMSPSLASRILPGVQVNAETDQSALKSMGSKNMSKHFSEACVDNKSKVVSTPEFIIDTELHNVYEGIGAMVMAVLNLVKK